MMTTDRPTDMTAADSPQRPLGTASLPMSDHTTALRVLALAGFTCQHVVHIEPDSPAAVIVGLFGAPRKLPGGGTITDTETRRMVVDIRGFGRTSIGEHGTDRSEWTTADLHISPSGLVSLTNIISPIVPS